MRPFLALVTERVIIDRTERPFLRRDVPLRPGVAGDMVGPASLANDGNALVRFGHRSSLYVQLL